MSYIKHLDGLRALAVILVILFHSGIQIFSGGYIGVDIFFVLSGYLITGIIINKLKNNSFSFTEFYAKRIKRLIPSLTIVKIFSLVIGYYLMSPYQFFTLIDQALYSTILLSNFYLSKNSDYFSLSTFENPLMHTWSLSLEEQFYLIFPIFFLILYYKFKNKIVSILLFFLFFSLFLVQFAGNFTFEKPFIEDELFFFNQPGFASYFMLIGRLFEFLFGSVSYVLTLRLKKLNFSHNIMSYFGFALIILSFFLYDENSGFPNFLTLTPVLGTILIIIYYQEKNSYLNFLTYKPILFIGTISYSLYLWHQPLFAFYRVKFTSEIPVLVICLIILISFIFSYLSNKFFENKIKQSNFDIKKTIYIYLIVVLVLTSALFYLKSDNFQKGYKKNYLNKIPSENLNLVIDVKQNIKRFRNISLVDDLRLTKSSSKKKILILGDSMSTNWIDGLNQNKNLYNSNFEFNHLILDENCFKFLKSKKYFNKQFKKFVEEFQSDLNQNYYDKTFILLEWSKNSKFNLDVLINYLNNYRSKIYLVGNAKFQNVAKVAYNIAINKNIDKKSLAKEFFIKIDKKNVHYNYDIKKFSSDNKLHYIDEYELYCKNNLCNLFDFNLNLFMWDNDHLTEYGSRFLGKKIIQFFLD